MRGGVSGTGLMLRSLSQQQKHEQGLMSHPNEESLRLLDNGTSTAPGHGGDSSSLDSELLKPPRPLWYRVLTSIWAKLALVVVVGVLVGVLLWKFPWGKIPGVLDYMREHPGITVPPFFFCNAIAVVVLLPGAAFQMVAGAVYGIWVGWLLSFAGTSAGVLSAFLLGRYLFKDSLSTWIISKFPHYGVIEAAIFKEDGWKLVWLLRLTPGLPDSLLNYAMGLTSCSFSLFAAASCGALFGYSFLYAYIGHASRDIIATIRSGEVGNAKLRLGLTIGSVVLGCITLVYLIIVLRRALNKVLNEQAPAAVLADDGDTVLLVEPTASHLHSSPLAPGYDHIAVVVAPGDSKQGDAPTKQEEKQLEHSLHAPVLTSDIAMSVRLHEEV